MLTLLLFSIPLSSYITLSVVVMLLWAFFVMTKLQMDTAPASGKRAVRPEATPFTFFKPGENPAPIITPSTFSEQELAISVTADKRKPVRTQPEPDKPVANVNPANAATGTTTVTEPTNEKPASAAQPDAVPTTPVVTNPDFDEVDDTAEYALYQPRQVSVVAAPAMPGIVIDAKPGEAVEPTPEQLKTLKDLQAEADEKILNRKRKTEQLMKLAAGLDFEAYVVLFRTYFDQATAIQQQEPDRAFYVIFGELIANEAADVQEQLLMLLDKEPTDTNEEPEGLITATVYADELVATEEEEPAFT